MHTYITLHYIILHYITLHYITLHYIHAYIHYTTLHYITLHYIHTYIHTYMHTYIHTYVYIHTCQRICLHAAGSVEVPAPAEELAAREEALLAEEVGAGAADGHVLGVGAVPRRRPMHDVGRSLIMIQLVIE